jgi:hypothetical protein
MPKESNWDVLICPKPRLKLRAEMTPTPPDVEVPPANQVFLSADISIEYSLPT